jgi:hypothetical protein
MDKDEKAGASSAVAALKRSAPSRILLLCAFATVTHTTQGDSHRCAAVRRTAEQSSLEASDGTKSHCGGLAWICLPVRWTLLKIALQGTL